MRPSPITPTSSAPSTPQTGTWRHPRFDEITRRQNASTFSDRNIKRVLYNVGCLFALWLVEKFVRLKWVKTLHSFFFDMTNKFSLPTLFYAIEPFQPYSTYFITFIRAVFIFNILLALGPLVRRKDDLSDIPLTPAQRRLLGLPPSNTPPTPGSQYVTPPRYPRSSTPQSGSPSSAYSPSPLSGKGSPQGTPRGSPFSPNASPLLSKAIGGGFAGAKRPSYGSPSPLGPGSPKGNWLDGSSTPSPSTGKGPSVTLNNKWLWDKGRRRSGDARIFS